MTYEDAALQVIRERLNPIDRNPEVLEHVATWYRPQFTDDWYPYIPSHITEPKEEERWFVAVFPPDTRLQTCAPYVIGSIPLYTVYNNRSMFDERYSSFPVLISHFDYIFTEKQT